MNQSWSVIIFGYNEEKTLASVINDVNIFFESNKISDCEIILIDDGSTDDSEKIVKCLVESNKRLKYIRHKKNLGIGPALYSGYTNAKKENVIAIPADRQFNINELNQFINFPEKSFISFYREEMSNYSLYRRFLTKANSYFNKYVLGFEARDVNWVKAYKTRDLREIELTLTSSLISSEICAKLNHKRYETKESLSIYHNRIAGKSRGSSIKTLTQAVTELYKLYIVIGNFKKEYK